MIPPAQDRSYRDCPKREQSCDYRRALEIFEAGQSPGGHGITVVALAQIAESEIIES